MNLKLDYQITNLLHPHYVKDHGCVYDDLGWTVQIHNEELLNEINNEFDYNLKLEKKNNINEEVAYALWKYLDNKKHIWGSLGTEYDRNILDI